MTERLITRDALVAVRDQALADLATAKSDIRRLRIALVAAAIPLEVLNADNYVGAQWMAPELRESVAASVDAIRIVLKP